MNVRVSRSQDRANWEGVPYRSYDARVALRLPGKEGRVPVRALLHGAPVAGRGAQDHRLFGEAAANAISQHRTQSRRSHHPRSLPRQRAIAGPGPGSGGFVALRHEPGTAAGPSGSNRHRSALGTLGGRMGARHSHGAARHARTLPPPPGPAARRRPGHHGCRAARDRRRRGGGRRPGHRLGRRQRRAAGRLRRGPARRPRRSRRPAGPCA